MGCEASRCKTSGLSFGVDPITRFFYIRNAFFQLNLSVSSLFNKLSLKCCLSVAYYRETLSYGDTLYLYLYHIYEIYFSMIIFIFITINHIIPLTQTNLFFGHACQKFSLRLTPAYFFCQFQPGVGYKSVAYGKSRYLNQYCGQ